MKPQIRMVATKGWTLTYRYPARSFWLFGLTKQERQHVMALCVTTQVFDSHQKALACLERLYRDGKVARW